MARRIEDKAYNPPPEDSCPPAKPPPAPPAKDWGMGIEERTLVWHTLAVLLDVFHLQIVDIAHSSNAYAKATKVLQVLERAAKELAAILREGEEE